MCVLKSGKGGGQGNGVVNGKSAMTKTNISPLAYLNIK